MNRQNSANNSAWVLRSSDQAVCSAGWIGKRRTSTRSPASISGATQCAETPYSVRFSRMAKL